jgi:diguanylate cyclase (GGDEF)-like protein/PAS domain S-box-containing protein
MIETLHELARIATAPKSDAADIARACELLRDALDAEDAYVIRAGDPDFVKVGCDCPPGDYEIKQKGYWLTWRGLAENTRFPAAALDVSDRIATGGRALEPGRASTHIAAILPGDESNSEMLIVRGPWPEGLTPEQIRLFETVRPSFAHIVSNLLDSERRHRQRRQLEVLSAVSRAYADANEADGVLASLATALAKASGFDWVMISLYNDELDTTVERAINVARHSGTDTANVVRDGRMFAQEDATAQRQQTGQFARALRADPRPMLIPDVFEPRLLERADLQRVAGIIPALQKYYERAHILSSAFFAVMFQKDLLGMISFSSSVRRDFTPDEVEFLQALVSQAATIIQGLRLYRKLDASQRELRESEERFRSLVQNASDLITVIEPDTTVRYQSPSSRRLLGYAAEELVGTRLSDLLHVDDVARVLASFGDAMRKRDSVTVAEARIRHRDGSWRHIELVGTDQCANPAISGIVLNTRDVSERKLLEQQLRHQALHDPLTKLANRTRFGDRLEHALLRATRDATSVGVLFMDLDNFKSVNDSLGHAAGDVLLTRVAERVQHCLRPGDTVARLGGDEFAIMLEDIRDIGDATTVADRIFGELQAPFELDGKELIVRASLGIAISGELGTGETDADKLLRDADVAMYVAKSRGKGCYELFEGAMQVSMVERMELLADLQRAVERREFLLHYQPLVLLDSGELIGVEALVRWDHPKRGVLLPAEFIPLAEESGVIVSLGRWVLTEACRQAAEWQRLYPNAPPWTMSVNVSVKQLQQPTFVSEVASVLETTGLSPSALILEITESVMMQDVKHTMQLLNAFKDLGVRLAIDDFGTGYSSLSYLKQFPFDLLKIDKSFVDDTGQSASERELTRAIIDLGKTLHMEIVAEGIERGEQLDRLREMDCDLGQGYYFAEPRESGAIGAMLRAASEREEAA